MNQKHLLRFIKKKMRVSHDMAVYAERTSPPLGDRVLTLKQVFDRLNFTAYDLNIDMVCSSTSTSCASSSSTRRPLKFEVHTLVHCVHTLVHAYNE